MGKLITLPSWLSPTSVKSGADIPAQADISISGQDITASNIKLSEVRNVLGESTYSLYALCRSANIQKWSPYRPGTWYSNGAGGSVWLPSGSSQPNFVPSYPAESKLGDFALYDHLLGRVPTYYDWHNVTTLTIEEGDTTPRYIQLKKGWRVPVCQETGACSGAWAKLQTEWYLDTTLLKTSPSTSTQDTVPDPSGGYLEQNSGALGMTSGQTKTLYVRPYYVNGTNTKVSMIEDGQLSALVTCVTLLNTGTLNSYPVTGSGANRTLTANWTVYRTAGAPTKDIDIKIRITTNEAGLGNDILNAPIEDLYSANTMAGGTSLTQTTTRSFTALNSPSQTGNNYVALMARLTGTSTWITLSSQRISWT